LWAIFHKSPNCSASLFPPSRRNCPGSDPRMQTRHPWPLSSRQLRARVGDQDDFELRSNQLSGPIPPLSSERGATLPESVGNHQNRSGPRWTQLKRADSGGTHGGAQSRLGIQSYGDILRNVERCNSVWNQVTSWGNPREIFLTNSSHDLC